MYLQHFILTRFNLSLWKRDKEGEPVNNLEWLTHRFYLFEHYCFPSIVAQTSKDFRWIILFNNETPDFYKDKIISYQKQCTQLIPIFVESKSSRSFAKIFKTEVVKRLSAKRVITTYLDNDDALNIGFVEDVMERSTTLEDGTFINYNDGFQFYSDHNYLMRVNNPRNHFMSIVECGDPSVIKTIYGYGSHYFINKIDGVKMEHIHGVPIWCEVVHERNMDNDAYFLRAKMSRDSQVLHRDFGLDEDVRVGIWLYIFRFLPRYVRTFIRRIGFFFKGRNW